MAEINLRNYVRKIEQLIRQGSNEEAIAHAQHILKRFPKHADIYRLLSTALLQQSRWDAAADMAKRLLAAFPNDFTGHFNLSNAYDHLNRPDDAIWHVERAYDQRPNDEMTIMRLRELYQRYREQTVKKVQLTAGAVAEQYMAGGMHDQAINVLQDSVLKMPDRTDLKEKLAAALWARGRHVDAAEVAVEVLKKMPYALRANQIMAQLWMDEERPSDARRYLNRIEDLDPYLALQIVTAEPVSDEAFKIEELNFKAYAGQQLTRENPDWLSTVREEDADSVDLSVFDKPDEDLFGDLELTDDEAAKLPAEGARTGLTGRLSAGDDAAGEEEDDDDAWLEDLEDSADFDGDYTVDDELDDDFKASGGTGLTGLLNSLDQQSAAEETDEDDDSLAWLEEGDLDLDEDPFADVDAATAEDDDGDGDAMAWLEESGAELADDDDDDPMAWLQDSDVELADLSDEDSEPAAAAADDDDSAMAWMRDSDIEMADEPYDPFAEMMGDDEDDSTMLSDQEDADPMAWAQSGDIDMLDDDEISAFDEIDEGKTAEPLMWQDEESEEESDEMPAAADDAAAPEVAAHDHDEPAADEDEAFLEEFFDLESLTEQDESELDDESTEWQGAMSDQWQQDPNPEDEHDDELDWLDEEPVASEDADPMAWLNESDSLSDVDDASADDDDEPDWMAEFNDEEDSEDDEDAAVPAEDDWLAELEQPQDNATGLTGLLSTLDDSDDSPATGDEDWLNELGGEDEEPEAVANDADWLNELGDEDEEPEAVANDADWLNELGDEDEEPEAVANDADWLNELGDEDEESGIEGDEAALIAGAASAAALGAPAAGAWLDDDDDEGEAAEPDDLDFLDEDEFAEFEASVSDDEELDAPDAEAEAADEFDFMEPDEFAEFEASVSDDEELDAPEMEESPEVDEEFDWLSETEFEQYEAGEVESQAAPLEPDHMDTVEQFDQAEWLEEEGIEPEQAPDWMAELDDETAEPVAEEPDWIDELDDEPVADDEAAVPAEADWIDELQDAEPEDELEEDFDAEFDEIFDEETASDELEEDEEDWWAEPQLDAEEDALPAAVVEGADDEMDDELPDNAPDWLNAMVPGLDLDYDAPEDEPVDQGFVEGETLRRREQQVASDQGDYQWVNDIVEAEENAMPAPPAAAPIEQVRTPRFSFSRRPAWLRRLLNIKDEEPDNASAAIAGGTVASADVTAEDAAYDESDEIEDPPESLFDFSANAENEVEIVDEIEDEFDINSGYVMDADDELPDDFDSFDAEFSDEDLDDTAFDGLMDTDDDDFDEFDDLDDLDKN